MILRHVLRVPFYRQPIRQLTRTLNKFKDDKFETYYEILGVPEDANGMQIEGLRGSIEENFQWLY